VAESQTLSKILESPSALGFTGRDLERMRFMRGSVMGPTTEGERAAAAVAAMPSMMDIAQGFLSGGPGSLAGLFAAIKAKGGQVVPFEPYLKRYNTAVDLAGGGIQRPFQGVTPFPRIEIEPRYNSLTDKTTYYASAWSPRGELVAQSRGATEAEARKNVSSAYSSLQGDWKPGPLTKP